MTHLADAGISSDVDATRFIFVYRESPHAPDGYRVIAHVTRVPAGDVYLDDVLLRQDPLECIKDTALTVAIRHKFDDIKPNSQQYL